MKFSVNWLREFVELPESAEALADLLTMSGIEIEGTETRGADFANVVVAQITESKPHPNADRLSVCMVDDGGGKARQIVCGAKNYKVGDKVPLALPGAELPGGLKIRASKLRGVESEGMLCSAKELRLAEDASGLLILSPAAKIGAPIGEVFPSDTIFDVEITPNRGDLLSHFGLAREISALVGRPLRLPTLLSAGGAHALQRVSGGHGIKISAPRECPFYSIQKIENVTVGPSPDWLRAKIESVGLRSINNVVDISNFVMIELGQPTHAFDAAKLKGEINVRLARDGEKFLALDGKTYSLTPKNLVIADAKNAVGIAGVMGGEDSGVSARTKTVLLESAYFLPANIRSTARDLNLPSDASYRFERGVDPQMILPAAKRVTELICELAGGKATEKIDVAGDLPANPPDVSLRYERLDQLLGLHVEPRRADEILTRFGLQKVEQVCATFAIPSFRRDLQREVDLIEEVARGHGLEKIPSRDRSRFTPASKSDRNHDEEAKVRRALIALGLSEARTSSLIARSELAKTTDALALRNPLSEEHVALRTSLLPGLLNALAHNLRAGAETVGVFEIGNIFAKDGEQTRQLALILCGHTASDWRAKARTLDFFDMKGILQALGTFEFRRRDATGRVLAAEVLLGNEAIGSCGQLSAILAAELDARKPVLTAELELAPITRIDRALASFRELERFPAITRDVAMFVGREVTHEKVLHTIEGAAEPLLERIELFDLFSEKNETADAEKRKSLAFSLTYRDKARTLTNEEVSAAHARIRERLRSEVGAELRE